MRASSFSFSSTALTRLYNPLIILRQREHTRTGRGFFKPPSSSSPILVGAKCGGGVVWMAQRLHHQHQQQQRRQRRSLAAACASAVSVSVDKSDGGHCFDSFSGAVVTGGDGDGDGDALSAEPRTRRKSSLVVVSFYKFAELPDYAEMRTPLRTLCDAHQVSGGIILAPEGINGSICGTRESVEKVFAVLQADQRLEGMRRNEAPATEEDDDLEHGQTSKSPLGAGDDAPFRWGHVRVKLKAEVVTLGLPDVRPSQRVGKYVKPKDWNALIADPGTVVVDVRNDYETRIGKFRGAVDPQTESFRDFPIWAENRFGLSSTGKPSEHSDVGRDPPDHGDGEVIPPEAGSANCSTSQERPARIAMYCTGGIRCEKATSYLMERGFDEVYHLEGGILKYLEQMSPTESMWEGECFVFDKRVSVDHGLKQGTHTLCYACKKPVNDDDKLSPLWEEGVSCPFCSHLKSPEEKERARARQIQFKETGVIGGPGNGKALPGKKSEGSRSPLGPL